MQPGAEEKYRARLIACHACAESEKAQHADHPEPGIHVVIERTE
jgi:hypothetical protein